LVFSSQAFLFWFLPLALGLYHLSPRRARHAVLAALSYGFYAWSGPAWALLLLASTLLDYTAGRVLTRGQPGERLSEGGTRTRAQRAWLLLSLGGNLGLLGFFKYAGLAEETWAELAAWLGGASPELGGSLRLALPLGISFYTFQSMSYTLDVYRGRARATRSFVDFACYVSMFPQLVAGPILRYQEVAAQLERRTLGPEKLARGVALLGLGLAKKVLLANPCGALSDTVFGAGSLDAASAWLGASAYAFQIYFDFSGYSDMAIGLGLMLGFTFPRNFDAPYQARSLGDFWRRWHLSLGTWLRDYLYIPLGGNRAGPGRAAANLMLVMLLGGLWHGARFTFVLWGGLHGLLLVAERLRGRRALWADLPGPLQVVATWLVVTWAFVLFRASDLDQALRVWAAMLGLGEPGSAGALLRGLMMTPHGLVSLGLAAAVAWGCPQAWDFTRRLSAWRAGLVLGAFLLAVLVLATQAYNPFIYFIF
jgi:alginate O-acetyltransferase complex protein AlgI